MIQIMYFLSNLYVVGSQKGHKSANNNAEGCPKHKIVNNDANNVIEVLSNFTNM
jgi:hypothetical protein